MKTETVVMWDSPEAAELRTVTGWVSRNGMFFGEHGESTARYSGSTHRLCEDCKTAVVEKHRICCDGCKDVRDLAKYLRMPELEWDGDTPLYSDSADKYFFDSDDLDDFIADRDDDPSDLYESLRLIVCDPVMARTIDPVEHYMDELPEDPDESHLPPEIVEAFEKLNKVIKDCKTPLSWYPGKYRIARSTYLMGRDPVGTEPK